ncbi:MAG: hypothetical protein HOP20_02490 [Sulfuriferula sp.]|nr:hypothetical protein [Sulfuriferula sp.]
MMKYTTNADLQQWLGELDALEKNKTCVGPGFIKPFHFATLVHILRKHEPAQLALPEKITSYARTMNLWGVLGIESTHDNVRERTAGTYHPIELLKSVSKVDETANALMRFFEDVSSDKDTNDAISTMLRELIGNCYAHSDVKDGVFGAVCA